MTGIKDNWTTRKLKWHADWKVKQPTKNISNTKIKEKNTFSEYLTIFTDRSAKTSEWLFPWYYEWRFPSQAEYLKPLKLP